MNANFNMTILNATIKLIQMMIGLNDVVNTAVKSTAKKSFKFIN